MKPFFKGFFVFQFMLFVLIGIECVSQVKLHEKFEGTEFPPYGWTVHDVQGDNGRWSHSEKYSKSGAGCAVSEFDTTFGSSFLVTRRIVPSAGDSLTFYLRQTFYRVYSDTLKVFASRNDSLPSSMNQLLLLLKDGENYPAHQHYQKYSVSLSQFEGDTIWIGFQHVDSNGEILRIDDVRVGNPYLHDIEVSSLIFSSNVYPSCGNESIVPQAVVSNVGESDEVMQFNVTLNIQGPQTYENTQSVSLPAGTSIQISFAAFEPGEEGEYWASAYSMLSADQNRANDSAEFALTMRNYSHGNDGNGYYFSSSEICGMPAPASPEFYWRDTSSSTVLMKDGSDVSNGLLTGNADNGYFTLADFLPDRKHIKFYGHIFDTLFVSTNGFVSLVEGEHLFTPSPPEPGAISTESAKTIAPLWMDFDNSASAEGNRISFKIAGNNLLVTFDRMRFNFGDSADYASFQLKIGLVDQSEDNSEILFQFDTLATGEMFKRRFREHREGDCFTGLVSGSSGSFAYRHKIGEKYYDAGPVFNISSSIEFGTVPELLNSGRSVLSLQAKLEGYQHRPDTVKVALAYYSNPEVVMEEKSTILGPGGNALIDFSFAEDGCGYYIIVKHRNSVSVWSKDSSLNFSGRMLSYDFTSDTTQAYGNNLVMIDGKACIFSGEVNGDNLIDVSDASVVDNNANNYLLGYSLSDLNGDGIVDSWDMLIVDRNSERYVTMKSPLLDVDVFRSNHSGTVSGR